MNKKNDLKEYTSIKKNINKSILEKAIQSINKVTTYSVRRDK